MCVLQENGIEDARKQISFFLPEYSNPLFRPLEKYKTEFMYDEAYKEACNDAFTDYQNRTMKSISKGTHFESADIGLFLIEPEICDVVGIHQERMANFIGYCIAMLGRMERKECHEVAQKIAPYQIPQVYIISKYIEEQSNEPLEDLVYCA